jgi:DNA-damage-inducible protein J
MANQGVIKTGLVRARVDEDTKHQAETVLDSIGLSMSEAIRLFTKQIALRNEFPLELKVPNQITRDALQQSQNVAGLEKLENIDRIFD